MATGRTAPKNDEERPTNNPTNNTRRKRREKNTQTLNENAEWVSQTKESKGEGGSRAGPHGAAKRAERALGTRVRGRDPRCCAADPGPNPRDGALRWKAAGWRAVRMQQRIRIRWELDRPGARCARAVEKGVRGRHVSAPSACSAAASLGPLGQWVSGSSIRAAGRAWRCHRELHQQHWSLASSATPSQSTAPSAPAGGSSAPGPAPARPWLIARSGLSSSTHRWSAARGEQCWAGGEAGGMSLPLLGCCSLNPRSSCATGTDPVRPSDDHEIADSREPIRAVGLRVGFKLHSSCAAHRALFRQPGASLHFPKTVCSTRRTGCP